MLIRNYKSLQELFIKPERTPAGISFGNPPNPVSFKAARVVVYGVPFDDTATFGKGSERGPEAIRHTSGRQVETYCIDADCDVYERTPVFDLGDLKIPCREKFSLAGKLEHLNVLRDITQFIRAEGKIPLMLGGEHTLSYWPLSALADQDPVVVHFDAHRDAKQEYNGLKLCHTTPMYHFLTENIDRNIDFVQIGIRQADAEEEKFAREIGIKTFSTEQVRKNRGVVGHYLEKVTDKRNVYITLDIDALDCCYTPCTGTPEPFGLTPQEIVDTISSIKESAKLIGADFVEVVARGEDFREGTLATQILLRALTREFVSNA